MGSVPDHCLYFYFICNTVKYLPSQSLANSPSIFNCHDLET